MRQANFAKESALGFEMDDDASVRQLVGTLHELDLGDGETEDLCPVCGGPTDRRTSYGFALPCVNCPRPPTPPSRRSRPAEAGTRQIAHPTSIATTGSGDSTSNKRRTAPPAPIATAAALKQSTSAQSEPTLVPEKPLVVVPKGWALWGVSCAHLIMLTHHVLSSYPSRLQC